MTKYLFSVLVLFFFQGCVLMEYSFKHLSYKSSDGKTYPTQTLCTDTFLYEKIKQTICYVKLGFFAFDNTKGLDISIRQEETSIWTTLILPNFRFRIGDYHLLIREYNPPNYICELNKLKKNCGLKFSKIRIETISILENDSILILLTDQSKLNQVLEYEQFPGSLYLKIPNICKEKIKLAFKNNKKISVKIEYMDLETNNNENIIIKMFPHYIKGKLDGGI